MTHEEIHHLISSLTALDLLGGHRAVDTDSVLHAIESCGLGDAHDVNALLEILAHHGHGFDAAHAALNLAFLQGHHVEPNLEAPVAPDLPGGYYNADGTYHYDSDNTDRDPSTGAIIRRW